MSKLVDAGMLGAVVVCVGGCPSRGPDPSPPLEPAAAAPEASRPVLYGVAVNDCGDPLPGVELLLEQRRLGRTNRFGEFCVELPPTRPLRVVARRQGFLDAALDVSSPDDVECVVRMRFPPPTRTTERFYVVDADQRGVPGLSIAVHECGAAEPFWSGVSGPDGSVCWSPNAAVPAIRHDVHVTTPLAGDSWVRSVCLVGDRFVPVRDVLTQKQPLRIEWRGPDVPRDGTMSTVFDETGRRVSLGGFDHGVLDCTVPPTRGLWVFFDDTRIASLLQCSRSGADTSLSAGPCRRVVEIPDAERLASLAPVLVPDFGDARAIHGAQITDLEDGSDTTVPRIAFARSGSVLRTPELDLDLGCCSIRPGSATRDVRLVLSWPPSLPAGLTTRPQVRVHGGTGSVTLEVATEGAVPNSVRAVLARRGGPYAVSQPLSGTSCTWSDLCAGTFVLALQRPVAQKLPRGTTMESYECMRLIILEPGEHVTVRSRLDSDPGPSVAPSIERK